MKITMFPSSIFKIYRLSSNPKTFTVRFKRKLCSGNQHTKENLNEDSNDCTHIYKKRWTKDELFKYLENNICYKDELLMTLNKPWGIVYDAETNESKGQKNPRIVYEEPEFSPTADFKLKDVLTDLLFHLKLDYHLLYIPLSYVSGLTMLVKNLKHVKQVSQLKQSHPFMNQEFLAVVLGEVPQTFKTSTKVIPKDENGNFKILSKGEKLKMKSLVFRYAHECLDSSEFGSLLKIQVSGSRENCLALFLAHQFFAPILGDSSNCSKVVKLFGVPLLCSNPDNSQVIESKILKRLQLNFDEVNQIPYHLHQLSIKVKLGDDEITASVPPPEHFVWTCEQLELHKVKELFNNFQYFHKHEKKTPNS